MKSIDIKSPAEIEIMKVAGHKLARVIERLTNLLTEDYRGIDVEDEAQELIALVGGRPSFPIYDAKYPYATCISVDDAIVHGLPSKKFFCSGQLVGLDIGLYYQGFHVDSAITVGIGRISYERQNLINVTRRSLEQAIEAIKPGVELGLVSATIQQIVEQAGYSVIRNLTGHGIGRSLHESPPIPNFGQPSDGPILTSGMVLAIEPMVSSGQHQIYVDRDGWTVRLRQGVGVHFEHTVAITTLGAIVLTR